MRRPPLDDRVLAREGMREGELIALTWDCVDLTRGVLTLDDNKTDDPRAWAMTPGVTRALSPIRPVSRLSRTLLRVVPAERFELS